MKITSVRHAWPEKKGFNLYRHQGMPVYSFLHFWKPLQILVNGEMIHTKPNAVIIINKYVPQHFFSPDNDVIHDWFHFEGNDVEDLMVNAGLEFGKIYYPKNCSFISDIIQSIEGESFGEEKNHESIISSYTNILFSLLGRRASSSEEEYPVDYQTQMDFKALRSRIFSNLDRNWTILHMAEQVNLSESRFFVLYKAIFKTTPNQDLIIARMNYAKRLLSQNTTASVFDIALECGYSNEFHFIRQFKKHVGMTPKKYALLYRNI